MTAALRPARQLPPRRVGAERFGPVVLADHPLRLAPGKLIERRIRRIVGEVLLNWEEVRLRIAR